MNKVKLEYYKESGIANPISILLVMFCSLITILFFSYFYSLIINYLSFIYLNFIIVIIFGFIISYISRFFNIVFKIRNKKKSIIITIVLSFFALYFQWVNYLYIVSIENFSLFMVFEDLEFFFEILFRPDLVLNDIIEISKVGLWSMGTSGATPNGVLLWLVWIAEAAAIVYISVKSFISFNLIPFSEKDNKWFKKELINFDFERIAFKKQFVENFASDPFESINQLKHGDGLRYSKIAMYTSETETKNIITIDNIIVRQRGKGKKDITNVLKLCYVDSLFSSQIRSKHLTKKASIFD